MAINSPEEKLERIAKSWASSMASINCVSATMTDTLTSEQTKPAS